MAAKYGRTKSEGAGFDGVKEPGGNKSKRFEDIYPMYEMDGDFHAVRLLGPLVPIAMIWFELELPDKDKKGKTKIVRFPKYPLNWDTETGSFDSSKKCPYHELHKSGKAKSRIAVKYLSNCIDREAQEEYNDLPDKKKRGTDEERETGIIAKDSKTKTCVRVIGLPSSMANAIKGMKDINKVKSKDGEVKTFHVNHDKFGCDIEVKHIPNKEGTDQYQVQKGERSPLTDEEKEYLVYDVTVWDELIGLEKLEDAKEEAKRIAKSVGGGDDEDEDEDEDEDDIDLDAEDDEDDEDEKPKKKAGKDKGKSRKKAKDDDDDDDDDEDEDEEPAKKKSSKGKKKAKDDDDDEDFDFDDDEEEDEDEKPKSKKKAPAKKGKDDDDDDDDDEDEKPKSKSKKKPKDDDEDDEEEDEKPKKKAGKDKKKSKAKDDDEDDDFDFDEDEDD